MTENDDLLSFCVGTASAVGESELEMYMRCSFDKNDLKMDPVKFWSKNQQRFPKLSKLAIRVLTPPASSLLAEQLFSLATLTISDRRASLDPQTFNDLLFIKSNKDLL